MERATAAPEASQHLCSTGVAWSPQNLLASTVPLSIMRCNWETDPDEPDVLLRSLRAGPTLSRPGGCDRRDPPDPFRAAAPTPADLDAQHVGRKVPFLSWSQKGDHLASVDEWGKVVIWGRTEFIDKWKVLYTWELNLTVLCFRWFNSDRSYVSAVNHRPSEMTNNLGEASEGKITRDEFRGPWNPHGRIAFIVVSSEGRVIVFFQHVAETFSKVETAITPFSSLTGGDGHFSHCDLALGDANNLYIVLYSAPSRTGAAFLYELSMDLLANEYPAHHHGGGLRYKPLFRLSLNDAFKRNDNRGEHSEPLVRHVALCRACLEEPVTRVCFSVAVDDVGGELGSTVGVWELRDASLAACATGFEEFALLGREQPASAKVGLRPVLVHTATFRFARSLVTCLKGLSDGGFAVGFGNGLYEVRPRAQVGVMPDMSCDVLIPVDEEHGSTWTALTRVLCDTTTAVRRDFHGDRKSVVNIVPSPNRAYLGILSACGELRVVPNPASPYHKTEESNSAYVRRAARDITVSLLNGGEPTDIVQAVLDKAKFLNFPDLIEQVFELVHEYYDDETGLSSIENPQFDPTLVSPLASTVLGLQLAAFRYNPRRRIQYEITFTALNIQAICEVFFASLSAQEEFEEWLAKGTNTDPDSGSVIPRFHEESYLSLAPLVVWIIDLTSRIVWNLDLLTSMMPLAKSIPSLGALLLHFRTRGYHQQAMRLAELLYQQIGTASAAIRASPGGGSGLREAEVLRAEAMIATSLETSPLGFRDMQGYLSEVDFVTVVGFGDINDIPGVQRRCLVRGLLPLEMPLKQRKMIKSVVESYMKRPIQGEVREKPDPALAMGGSLSAESMGSTPSQQSTTNDPRKPFFLGTHWLASGSCSTPTCADNEQVDVRQLVRKTDIVRKVPIRLDKALRQCVRCGEYSMVINDEKQETVPCIRTGDSSDTQRDMDVSPPLDVAIELPAWTVRFSMVCVCGGFWKSVGPVVLT